MSQENADSLHKASYTRLSRLSRKAESAANSAGVNCRSQRTTYSPASSPGHPRRATAWFPSSRTSERIAPAQNQPGLRRKDAYSTLDPTLQELLRGRYIATLGTENADGTIHLTAVWYLFEEGYLFVATSSKSRKARNILVRPQAAVWYLISKEVVCWRPEPLPRSLHCSFAYSALA